MKKAATLIISFILLNGATELHQLWKLPFLAKHYNEHLKENPTLSLIKFLKIHYSDCEYPNDNNDNDDNKLPFKSEANITHTDIPIVVKQDIPVPVLLPENAGSIKLHAEGIPCDRSFTIFHPPRIT